MWPAWTWGYSVFRGVTVGVSVAVSVGATVGVSVGVPVRLAVGVAVTVGDRVSEGVADDVAVGLAVGVSLGMAVRVLVGVERLVAVAVNSGGHPVSALFTTVISSSIATSSSWLASNAGQSASGLLPSEMLTPVTSSSIAMSRSPLQSPTHGWARASDEHSPNSRPSPMRTAQRRATRAVEPSTHMTRICSRRAISRRAFVRARHQLWT